MTTIFVPDQSTTPIRDRAEKKAEIGKAKDDARYGVNVWTWV
jgi:hypothetical protein